MFVDGENKKHDYFNTLKKDFNAMDKFRNLKNVSIFSKQQTCYLYSIKMYMHLLKGIFYYRVYHFCISVFTHWRIK